MIFKTGENRRRPRAQPCLWDILEKVVAWDWGQEGGWRAEEQKGIREQPYVLPVVVAILLHPMTKFRARHLRQGRYFHGNHTFTTTEYTHVPGPQVDHGVGRRTWQEVAAGTRVMAAEVGAVGKREVALEGRTDGSDQGNQSTDAIKGDAWGPSLSR